MTDRQKQYLLGYLGYYTGPVDGIWGALSRQAEEDFRKDNALTGEDTVKLLPELIGRGAGFREEKDMWQNTRYWKREEFRCRCGDHHAPYCDGYPAEPQRKLVELADQVRAHFGKPGISSSGLRCARHNRDCGGVANSRHLTGRALDFRILDTSAEVTLGYVRSLPGVRYAYAIDSQFVHMDIE